MQVTGFVQNVNSVDSDNISKCNRKLQKMKKSVPEYNWHRKIASLQCTSLPTSEEVIGYREIYT